MEKDGSIWKERTDNLYILTRPREGSKGMSMVCALKFNAYSGAIISDEEIWNIRFFRKLYLDNLHSLFNDKISDELGIEVIFGGAGYPSFIQEMVELIRERIDVIFYKKDKKYQSYKLETVEDVAKLSLQVMQEVLDKRVNNLLKFYYGFTKDDLNRGFFEEGGEKFEIKQDNIKKRALNIARGKDGSRIMKIVMNTRAMLLGYDKKYGISAYYLDPVNSIVAFNYEGWEAIGAGKYASGVHFSRLFNKRPLDMRKKGFQPAEGMLELVSAGIMAIDHFQQAGGNINIVYLDGSKATHQERVVEIYDERAKLTEEITRAYRAELLDRTVAIELIDNLLFKGTPAKKVEKDMFKKSKDELSLRFLLRGYKEAELPIIKEEYENLKKSKTQKRKE